MISVSEDLDRFLAKVKGYAEYVDNEIADRENDFRSMCFWNIYNRAVMTKEIVMFYTRTWEKIDVPIDLGPEITERIVTVTKDLFVDTVSSIEKASKDCVNAYKLSGLRDRSMIGAEWVSAPLDTKSTPKSVSTAIFSFVTFPDTSTCALPAMISIACLHSS